VLASNAGDVDANETLPRGSQGLPVTTLRVEVVAGPDVGTARVAEADTLTIGSADGNDLVLRDPTVSRFHVDLSRGANGITVRDHHSTNDTMVAGVRIRHAVVPAGTVLALGDTRIRISDGDEVVVEVHGTDNLRGLRGRTPGMQRLMARIERASQTDKAVLLIGESGTGKEICGRALHDLGPRRDGPFETVDSGALSANLVASELFGHERGAFTGADRQHIGAFERAAGGTLFLDEIGELPETLQATLLGVLERHKIRRVGGRTDIPVDVRVIAATNRDLRAEVNAGSFRLDLYYRLAVVVLALPPLRDRPDDIPLLVEHFVRDSGYVGRADELFTPETMRALRAHRWPGNVRELRNLVEATLAMGETPEVDGGVAIAGQPEPPPTSANDPSPNGPADLIESLLELPYKDARDDLLRQFESRYVRHLLERTKGNVSRAAREARMDRSHLTDLLVRHKIR
jgi:DNA-binding NtrC family response regulator